jgi:hypothetical protein
LKNTSREDNDDFIKVSICINLLRVHLPELTIHRLSDFVQAMRAMMKPK